MVLLFKQVRGIPIRKLNLSPIFSLHQLSGSMSRYISHTKLKQSERALTSAKSIWMTLQKTLIFYLTSRNKSMAEQAHAPGIKKHIDPNLQGLLITGSVCSASSLAAGSDSEEQRGPPGGTASCAFTSLLHDLEASWNFCALVSFHLFYLNYEFGGQSYF